MSYAPYNQMNNVTGSFVEKEFGKTFEYRTNPEMVLSPRAHGGKNEVFPHLIFVGPHGEETRQALVLGTCAHVIVDETDFGWVVEKWEIKKHRKYRSH